ncbi:MAG TPA: adenylate/guanylate cyclase domain-containing protein, partial [Bacteroidia bacterium]|nr:adenylate/guanylate cyclase domain-containing protein [Bacteroidia bacterium]
LKIAEEISDTLRMVTCMSNVGAVYALKANTYTEALSYLIRAYDLCESMSEKDPASIGTIAVNIGEIYFNNSRTDTLVREQKLDSALYYYQISLKNVENTVDEPYTLNDIGQLYMERKQYDKAIEIQKRAFEKAKNLEAKSDIAISLIGLAKTYLEKGDNKLALQSYLDAEDFAKEVGSNYGLRDIYDGLAQVYKKEKDFGNANKYLELLLGIKDTIYNIDANKKLGTLQFTFDIEKKQGQINLLTKDQELKEKEISRQKVVRNSFIGGFAVVLLFAGIFFRQRNRISKEKKRSDELLLNILPEETAEELKATGTAKAKSFDMVTVLFTDFKNFTQASERLSAEELVEEINYCYSEFDRIVTKYNIEKIKTIGDAYMCAGGLPVSNDTHPEDVVRAGLEMQAFIARNMQERIKKGQPYFELRLGIHTGPVVAGIVGIKKFAYDIWGDTVNTASRMESSGETGKVNISEFTYELVKDKFIC